MQLFILVIFAALAGVLLFQFYAILGKRIGRQPGDPPDGRARPATQAARKAEPAAELSPERAGLQAIAAREPSFDPARFLEGARGAYEMIVKAFAAGDRSTLRRFTSPAVFSAFDRAIADREAAQRTEQVELLSGPRADAEGAEIQGDIARVKVRFLAELRTRTKDARGEGVDDRRTAEVWTFERTLGSADPNWTLARVDAAEH